MIHDDETRPSTPPGGQPGFGQPYPGERPPPPRKRTERGFTIAKALPVAVVLMAAVVAFIIVWLLTHHSTKSSPQGAVASSGKNSPTVTVTHGPSSSTSPARSSTSTSTSAVEPTAAPSTVTTTTSTTSSSPSSVDFPAGTVSQCVDYLGSGGYKAKHPRKGTIGDPGARVDAGHTANSCDFLQAAASAVRNAEGNGGSSFTVDVPSAWRVANGYSPNVALACTMNGNLAHCVNHENSGVDLYVKP